MNDLLDSPVILDVPDLGTVPATAVADALTDWDSILTAATESPVTVANHDNYPS